MVNGNERQRERGGGERERDRDRQTDRQTWGGRPVNHGGYNYNQDETLFLSRYNNERDREGQKQIYINREETDRQRNRDRQTEKERQTDKDREKQRGRDTYREIHNRDC